MTSIDILFFYMFNGQCIPATTCDYSPREDFSTPNLIVTGKNKVEYNTLPLVSSCASAISHQRLIIQKLMGNHVKTSYSFRLYSKYEVN